MKNRACFAITTLVTALLCTNLWASKPPELQAALPVAELAGQATLRVWGFEVYQASLWVAPGFNAADYSLHAFALELSYLRDFTGADIAMRSIREMRRQGPIEANLEAQWEAKMRAVFPSVKTGDRITGIQQPGVGAVFLINGRPLGTIADPVFAKAFFGIWLSPQTSEPRLRTALLARAPKPAASP